MTLLFGGQYLYSCLRKVLMRVRINCPPTGTAPGMAPVAQWMLEAAGQRSDVLCGIWSQCCQLMRIRLKIS